MRDAVVIEKHMIGNDYPPFIVAEMSGNHNQSLDRALEIVDAAAITGAQALKLQTYTADTMTLDIEEGGFFIDDPDSLWKGLSLYNLYKKAHTPWEWHKPIFDRCRELGLIPFSTPFDASAVDFLEELDVQAYKIASPENTDHLLIRKVAATGKPLLISTGMANLSEIDESVRLARENGCKDIVLLKCTSSYPALPKDTHLLTIPHMRDLFGVQVGLSDHTPGIGVALAAVSLGASVIEKHFTLSRADGGVDAAFSIEPGELKYLVEESERAWQAMGEIHYGPVEAEYTSLKGRRSLYIVVDMQEGESFTSLNLRPIRPGFGLPVKYYDDILGKRINRTVKKGTPMSWGLIG